MRALQLQFNQNHLDLAFIASITPGCADRLLYINLMCSRHLLECVAFAMTEDQRFRYISLQENLLLAVERMHESHIAMRTHDIRATNESNLHDTIISILDLKAELSAIQLQEIQQVPEAVMYGHWPEHDRFVLTAAVH